MNLDLASGGTIEVSEAAFAREYNESLVHQVVTAYLAGGRQGSKAQKTRADVRGGGKKPWRQKGTGRARAGSNTSPLWRSGGKAFAAVPRTYDQKVNKKMYRNAVKCILSELLRQGRVVVVQDFEVSQPKTKLFVAKLKEYGVDKALIVSENVQENLYLASRNVPDVDVKSVMACDPVSLLSYPKMIITVQALKKFEEVLSDV